MSFVVARMQNRGAEHIPPKPNQVNQLMMQLVYEYNHDDDVDPYLREARFHIRFERIHPFEDGNGRTGRILVNRGLLQAGSRCRSVRASCRVPCDACRRRPGRACRDVPVAVP